MPDLTSPLRSPDAELPQRIFFDVSFTRTHHGTVGITRTVRRLFHELRTATGAQGLELMPVAYHREGFRLVADCEVEGPATGGPPAKATQVRRAVMSTVVHALFKVVPWPLLAVPLHAASSLGYSRAMAGSPPMHFRAGDLLLLGDASWNFPVWRAASQARACGAKVLVLMYDLIPLTHPQYCGPMVTAVFRDWLRRMLPRTDGIVCISGATQDETVKWCRQQGTACPPIDHFHLGCNLPAAPKASERIERFAAAGEAMFLSVGTLEPRKNHTLLLAAFEQLWQAGGQACLLVLGRVAQEGEALAQRLRTHPELGKRLLWLSDASDGEVALAYNRSRALVFCSLAEGFGLPLVEARAVGCRVIASDLPVFRELADEGVTLVATGSLEALVAALRQEIAAGHRALQPAAPTSWAESARSLLERTRALVAQ